MIDKKFIKPETITAWCVLIFETISRFDQNNANTLVKDMKRACESVGKH